MSRIRHWHDEVGCDNRNLIYNNRQLRSELKLEQKFNLRDAVYCLPQRYNSINGFCNFSNGATFKEVKEKFHKTLILASKVKYNTSFFSIFRQLLCAIGGAGMESCLLFDVWRMKKILDVCKFGHISLLCFWNKIQFELQNFHFHMAFYFLKAFLEYMKDVECKENIMYKHMYTYYLVI